MKVNLLVHLMDMSDYRMVLPYLYEDITDADDLTDEDVVDMVHQASLEPKKETSDEKDTD